MRKACPHSGTSLGEGQRSGRERVRRRSPGIDLACPVVRRWPLLVAIILGVVVAGTLAWDDLRRMRYCTSVTEARHELVSEPITDGDWSLLVVGDSYAQGFGLQEGPTVAWPSRLGQQLGVSVTVDGMGGTGFTTRGYCDGADAWGTYGERLSNGDRPAADAVVVQGGVNDALTGDATEVGDMAADVLDLLVETPNVVLVGPPEVRGAQDRDLRVIDESLRRAAREAGRSYVSLLSVDLPLLDDGIHPTEAGHQRITTLVARALRAG